MQCEPSRRVRLRGQVERRHEADELIVSPGDLVVVHRGVPRSVVIACPDGCGERLTVNLDDRAGPAWKLYEGSRGLTLYPSVWRDSGCGSHFIVWHDTVLWCDRFTGGNVEPFLLDDTLPTRVQAALTTTFKSTAQIAAELSEIPWEVGRACRMLVKVKTAAEGIRERRGWFSLPRTE